MLPESLAKKHLQKPLLFYTSLCPFARSIRLGLAEKNVDYQLQEERYDNPSEALYMLCPEGTTPVLKALSATLVHYYAIIEYLEETHPASTLLGSNASLRAEVRRIIHWFHDTLFHEVTHVIMREKVLRRRQVGAFPDSGALKAARLSLRDHLDYIGWLFDRRSWLAGKELSWADLVAAAQLSSLDYLGDVPWSKHPKAKMWYMRIKSRPSFKCILQDTVVGISPAHHYHMLDF
jgi:glutathione S-transferase